MTYSTTVVHMYKTLIPNSITYSLTRSVCVRAAYGWFSSSHSRLPGQEVVTVGVLVGGGVVTG